MLRFSFYYPSMLSVEPEPGHDVVEWYCKTVATVSKPFSSIYSRYVVQFSLEILMSLHCGCAFRWPLVLKTKWFA